MEARPSYSVARLRIETHDPGGLSGWRLRHVADLLKRTSPDFLPTLAGRPGGIRALESKVSQSHVAIVLNDAGVYGLLAVDVNDRRANVHVACVEREHRRKGWASAMHEAMVERLADMPELWTASTWSTNHAWLSVLDRAGYVPESLHARAFGPRVDGVHLVRTTRRSV